MNQDFTQQELLAGGGGSFSTTTGYATGATVPRSGNYQAENKYMKIVVPYGEGEKFLAGPDGKKTTWYVLAASASSNTDGSYRTVKVAPGTI